MATPAQKSSGSARARWRRAISRRALAPCRASALAPVACCSRISAVSHHQLRVERRHRPAARASASRLGVAGAHPLQRRLALVAAAAWRPAACRRRRAGCAARRSGPAKRDQACPGEATASSIAATRRSTPAASSVGRRAGRARPGGRLRLACCSIARKAAAPCAGRRSRCRSSAPPSAASPARHRPRPGPPAARAGRGAGLRRRAWFSWSSSARRAA